MSTESTSRATSPNFRTPAIEQVDTGFDATQFDMGKLEQPIDSSAAQIRDIAATFFGAQTLEFQCGSLAGNARSDQTDDVFRVATVAKGSDQLVTLDPHRAGSVQCLYVVKLVDGRPAFDFARSSTEPAHANGRIGRHRVSRP
jgi:hypothetical protein